MRFAPSPTGALHIGGVRTALYDYLFAKNKGGEFILRIEDTDTTRYVEGAEDYILEALEWCGIIPHESPKHGGAYGPYRQSERRSIYDRHIADLLRTEYAYIAFDTSEELESIRKEYEERGEVFSYNYISRNRLRNSLSLSPEEVQSLLDDNTPFVVRFKMPVDRILNLEDIIRGKFSVNTNDLDDKVLVKQDGMPTYHFANVVDDYEMKITHVIRGEEWLPSMGLHVLLYEAMGWNAPQFAHLSLILKPEGKGKLSKRDGDKFGFPVFPINFTDSVTGSVSKGYREEGYFPDAFVNFLALLGWSPSDDREILSLEEMINEFDIYKLHKSGARFSREKAEWFNHQYLQKKSDAELVSVLKDLEEIKSVDVSDEQLKRIVSLMKERVSFVKDIYHSGKFFFHRPEHYDEKSIKKAWNEQTVFVLESFISHINEIEDFTSSVLKERIYHLAEEKKLGMGKIMMPLRLSLVGELKGPDVPDIIEVIGKEETIIRIKKVIDALG